MNTSSVAIGINRGSGQRGTPVGGLLRVWRERRRLSQLELAGAAGYLPATHELSGDRQVGTKSRHAVAAGGAIADSPA
jgi:hypothetical protein